MSDPTLEIYREAVAITEKYEQLRARAEVAEKEIEKRDAELRECVRERLRLEEENERMKDENLAMRKNRCCCNCASKECDTVNCRVTDTSYAIDCLVNNRKHWKAVKNEKV